ncbi:unnamed protein product [Parnassius apollo]|uniref:(apollo) hypothetical protein n=1 Tax=Parnassius apollo TaxID=110799 RepID=A0A8S3WWU4_PARAO|nr:unnamed protein product [Parnassius apollo]
MGAKRPVVDCPTRWSSTYDMFTRLLEPRPICTENYELYLSDTTRNSIEITVASLKPSNILTKKLQMEQMTMSDFYLNWINCKIELKGINTTHACELHRNMEIREKVLFESKAFVAAVYMDPRDNFLLNTDQLEIAEKALVSAWMRWRKLNKQDRDSTVFSSPVTSTSTQQQNEGSQLEDFLDQSYNNTLRGDPSYGCAGDDSDIKINLKEFFNKQAHALGPGVETSGLLPPPDARQRGFVCADGTWENSAVLDAVLGDSRALVGLLQARRLPVAFCDYISRLYDSATTTMDVGVQSSATVKLGLALRQGDPLLPILFNMAMDVILAALPKEVGYRLEMERVSALAYADDLILLAGSNVGMQESIDRVFEVASSMGLLVNNNKSSVLSMVPDGKRRKHHYLTGKNFRIGRKWLSQTSCVERWRYLGIDFQASGYVMLEHDIKVALTNISKEPLKPQQRLEIVRGHLIPRFLHGPVLGNISDDRLSMLDV